MSSPKVVPLIESEFKCGEIIRIIDGTFQFNCTFCSEKFSSINSFQQHVNDHYDMIKLDFESHINGNVRKVQRTEITIDVKEELQDVGDFNPEEVTPVEYEVDVEEEVPDVEVDVKPTITGKTYFHCTVCEKPFRRKYYLDLHKAAKHTEDTNVKKEAPTESTTGYSTTNPVSKSYICDYCGKTFPRLSVLVEHILIHSGTRPFQCDLCKSAFFTATRLRYHRNMKHLKKSIFNCPDCNKIYGNKSHLKDHMKRHSQNPKPFNCEFCGWEFAEKGNLNRHIATHLANMANKSYPCPVCDKTFTQERYVRSHMTVHSGQKPFQCAICGHRFRTSTEMNKHAVRHTGIKKYKCDVCSRGFAHSDKLKDHRRRHFGDKPYNCSYCERKFADKRTLVVHERMHTGEKPFQCDFCGIKFIDMARKRMHEKNKHQICVTYPENRGTIKLESKYKKEDIHIVGSEAETIKSK